MRATRCELSVISFFLRIRPIHLNALLADFVIWPGIGGVGYSVIQSTAFDVKPTALVKAAKKLELERDPSARAHRTNPAAGAERG